METKVVLDRIQELSRPGITSKEVMQIYSMWAETYDNDIAKVKKNSTQIAMNEVMSLFGDNKEARILDVAAGTGSIGQHLRALGFNNLDAIDGCQEMLEKARAKDIYQNIMCALLGPDKLSIPNDTYDALVCHGGWGNGQMDHTCFEEFSRITKPVLMERLMEAAQLKDIFESAMKDMEGRNKWTIASRRVFPRYTEDYNGVLFVLQVNEGA